MQGDLKIATKLAMPADKIKISMGAEEEGEGHQKNRVGAFDYGIEIPSLYCSHDTYKNGTGLELYR